ncbi:hypothetical protein PVAND_013775 [Polypedilum vanderplanki]|uniref:Uncharacterized protein n=1 Tax=Polypedilum vanderplanki TaxID=319348 RepID=A0A9J6CRA0_POLVA|nr:hypothetical protein PVAND_013775 [Polypedilum vanderplanki]
MLSYMLPEEPKSPSSRNLSLNLNLQNTTTQSQTSSDTDQHEHDDADENTKLLSMEREDYVATKITNRNGNLIKNGGNKINYNMNITNGSLCNNNLISSSNDHNNHINNNNNISIIKNGDSTKIDKDADTETDSVATTTTIENTVNNNINGNEETNSSNGDNKKIIKMTKLGSKNVTLKR